MERICKTKSAWGLKRRTRVFVNGCLLILLFHAAPAAVADVFKQLVDMRHGADLFHQNRYQNSLEVFEPIYASLQQSGSGDLHRLLTVLNFLAQSKSFLGEHDDALSLMQKRLLVAEKLHGRDSPEYSAGLAGVAEAEYRSGNIEPAIATAHLAIDGLKRLDPESEYLKLAHTNVDKYRSGPFDPLTLPLDLSKFYSRCESIKPGDNEFTVDRAMTEFIELDVDYKPEGFWGAMFEIASQGPDGQARKGENHRRIFLPASDESVRQEICVVDQRSGTVVNAENSLE